MKKYKIKLTPEEKKEVKDILHKGKQTASTRNRAHVLQLSDKGIKDADISNILDITIRAICNIRKSYCQKGLEKCVFGEKRSGRPKEITIVHETELVALACSDPPKGRARWTLELLKDNMNKKIGKSSIQLMLKKTGLSLGSKRCGVSEK